MTDQQQIELMGETAIVPEDGRFVFSDSNQCWKFCVPYFPLKDCLLKQGAKCISFACEAAIIHFEGKAKSAMMVRQNCIHGTRGITDPQLFSSVSAEIREELDKAETWWCILEKVRAAR